MLPGMKFAVIARPPVVGGKVASLDDSATMKVPGVEKVVKIDGTPRAGDVRSARRRRGDRQEHLGGAQGPRGAQDHLGRRAEQRLRLRCLQGDARRRRAQARQGRAQRGRRRRGAQVGRQGDHGRVLRAASCARDHGAAGGDGAHDRRQVGGLGAGAEPGRRARRSSPSALGSRAEERDVAHARCSAAASAASRSATSPSRRRCCPRRWAARRSRWCGRARTTSGTASITP